MDPIQALLIGVAAPAGVAAALILLLRRPWPAAWSGGAAWATGLAVAAGYGVTFALILGWPALPPIDVTHAPPWLAVLAVAIAALPAGAARGRAVAIGGLGLLAGAFLVAPLAGGALDTAEVVLHVALIGATFLALDRGLQRATGALDPRAGAVVGITLVAVTAATVLLADVASLAQITGGLAAAIGAAFALGLWRPRAADIAGATPVIAAIVGSTLWSAVLYANGRYEVVALIVATPLILSALRPTLAKPRHLLLTLAIPALVALVPLGAAAGLAARAYFAPSASETAPAAAPGDAPAANEGYDPNYGY